MHAAPGSKVLIADDNAVDRQVLSAIVKRAGYEVIPAEDGIEAVDKYHNEAPDMVLLDALMPGKDGFEVAREIKASDRDDFVPIIFLTSLTEAQDLARCVESGGDDFLSKPYNKVILQAKLSAMDRMRTMHSTMQLQRDEIQRHHLQLLADQEAAKAVFDTVTHVDALDVHFIRHMLSPLALFNGDVLMVAQNPANNVYVMLGDFTGHGLAAAVGALPLSDVFYGMTRKGFALNEVVRECNRKLCSVLPAGYFCCASALYIDFSRKTLEYWNGGLPSVYLRRQGEEKIRALTSQNLPLGILQPDKFCDDTQVFEVETGDRVILATDGVIEARSTSGEYFGADRLEEIVANSPIDLVFDNVKNSVYEFMTEEDRDDDLTLVEVKVVEPGEISDLVDKSLDEPGPTTWKLEYELSGKSLKEFNPLPLLQHVLMEAPYLRKKSTQIYTILAEMYSNALEHGVLGLDSALKNSAEGFAKYYAARAQALENVNGHVRFKLEVPTDTTHLLISATDSGAGFDYERYARSVVAARSGDQSNKGYHGRGLALLWELCEQVNFDAPGNCVHVILDWAKEDD